MGRNLTQYRHEPWLRPRMVSIEPRRSGCLERKGKERGHSEKRERDNIIPRQPFLQERDREHDEDHDGDDFLRDLELESGELAVAEAIRRHREAVFDKRD